MRQSDETAGHDAEDRERYKWRYDLYYYITAIKIEWASLLDFFDSENFLYSTESFCYLFDSIAPKWYTMY